MPVPFFLAHFIKPYSLDHYSYTRYTSTRPLLFTQFFPVISKTRPRLSPAVETDLVRTCLSVLMYLSIFLGSTESGWKAQHERTRDQCIHGSGCKTGPSCKSRSSNFKLTMLSSDKSQSTQYNTIQTLLTFLKKAFQCEFTRTGKTLQTV